MDLKNLFSHDAFNCISDEQKKLFEALSTQLSDKTPNECMPIIMMFMQNIPNDLKLSEEEQNNIMNTFLETLTKSEQEQFKLLMKMAKQLQNR